jgi:anti-sigma regulatory factor (Ser/Thr protein kinase)
VTPSRPTSRTTTVRDTFVHEGLFYRHVDDYLTGTVPFLRAALDAGEPALVVVPGPRLAAIRDAVRDAVGAVDGRVRYVDMAHAGRNPGRIIPWVLHAFIAEHPGRHPAIVGESIWPGRSAAEYPACVQHEALINAAFEGRAATVLCPYDTAGLDGRVLADAHATHPVLVERDRRWASEAYAPYAAVEAYNRPLPVPDGVVTVREFADPTELAALRELAAGTGRRAGLSANRVAELQIVVTELTTNSLRHGRGGGTLRLWTSADHLVCEVRNPGRIDDPMAGRLPPEPVSLGGRGLLIVNYLCDLVRVYTDRDSSTVRLYIRR